MSEKLEEKLKLEILKDIPDSIKNQLEEGDMLLKARSLHKNFLPEPWFTKLAKDSVNNRVLWRHKDPENPKDRGRVYGRALSTDIVGDFHETFYRIFGGEEGSPEMKMQDLIKLKLEIGEPIGISKGFMKHKDKNGDIKRVLALEDSITYIPQCADCITQEVYLEMNEEEIKQEIKKLQDELNDTKLQLEAKTSTVDEKDKELEVAKQEFKVKLEELEAKISSKDTEKKTLEDKFVELSDKFDTFKVNAAQEKKQPIIDEIFKYEKDEDLLDLYKGWDMEKLEKRKQRVIKKSNEVQVITKSIEKDRLEALDELKTKDIGIGALRGMVPEDADITAAIAAEMKREGLIA